MLATKRINQINAHRRNQIQRASQINTYRRNQIQHASPLELVVMLYDRAILDLKSACLRLDEGKVKEKGRLVCHAVDIIAELQAVLDKERGGEIAGKLDQLYTYMLERITKANYDNDPKLFAEVIRLLEELQIGWRGLAQSSTAGQPAARRADLAYAGARQG